MTLSITGSILLIGAATGQVHLYDVASHQLLKTVNTHQGFRATYLSTFLKPQDLTGHVTLGSASHLDTIPSHPISSLHRIRDATARTIHDVPVMLPIPSDAPASTSSFALRGPLLIILSVSKILPGTLPPYSFEGDHRNFVLESSIGVSGQSLQTRVAELEGEMESLRQKLLRAKGLNDSMWESVVSTVLASDDSFGNGLSHAAKRNKVAGP